MCSRYHPPLYLCTYLIMGIWRNGNASDFGSEDCRFDPCYARLFIYNLSLYYIYTFIYTIILILFILYILYTILFIHYTLYTIIIFKKENKIRIFKLIMFQEKKFFCVLFMWDHILLSTLI